MWRTFFATRTEFTTRDDLRRLINCALTTDHKHTVWLALNDQGDERPLFAVAGIYRQ
jgi:hypothetical protein